MMRVTLESELSIMLFYCKCLYSLREYYDNGLTFDETLAKLKCLQKFQKMIAQKPQNSFESNVNQNIEHIALPA